MLRLPSIVSAVNSRRMFLAQAVALSTIAAGCGADTYEARLKQTQLYFGYLEQVNLALVPKAAQLEGVEIRPPKGFELLTLPPAPKEGEPEVQIEPANDPTRLGYDPNFVLEGVLGTWRATVRTEAEDANGTAFAYLHLLSNAQRWLDQPLNNEIEPTAFLVDSVNQLANALNVEADTSVTPWDWERVSGLSPFVPKQKIDRVLIQPEIKQPNPPVDVFLHRLDVKQTQVVLVLIVPRGIDSHEKIESRFKHTLETLKVSGVAPKRQTKKSSAGGF